MAVPVYSFPYLETEDPEKLAKTILTNWRKSQAALFFFKMTDLVYWIGYTPYKAPLHELSPPPKRICISILTHTKESAEAQLANIRLFLNERGIENINVVKTEIRQTEDLDYWMGCIWYRAFTQREEELYGQGNYHVCQKQE